MLNDIINSVTEFTGLDRIELAIVLLVVAIMAIVLSFVFFSGKEDDDSNIIIGVGIGF